MKDLLFSLEENELIKKLLGNVDLSSISGDDLQKVFDKLKNATGESEEENQLLKGILAKVSTVYDTANLGADVEKLVKGKGADLLKGLLKK